jgi:hypothetical protein
MSPPVPNTPEPPEALRKRYPAALEHVYDQAAIVERGGIRPGEVAAQVFDHADGLRLIISRERTPSGHVVLHVSASMWSGSRVFEEYLLLRAFLPPKRILAMFAKSIPERFRELSGDARPMRFLYFTSGVIPHFVIEESEVIK